jgi:hypothetical protein
MMASFMSALSFEVSGFKKLQYLYTNWMVGVLEQVIILRILAPAGMAPLFQWTYPTSHAGGVESGLPLCRGSFDHRLWREQEK